MKYCIAIFAALVLFSCKKNNNPVFNILPCMQPLIDSAMAKPKGTVLLKIDTYEYKGDIVYLYYNGCCDAFNDVKDSNCNRLFSPSGGIGGGGDHSHPNFFSEAKFIMTVWADPRL